MKHLNQALAANSAANAEDVVATKLFLRHQGHYAPPKSGISQFPDRALFDAIKTFQQSQGLKVDGVMNPEGETETAIKAQAQQLQSMGRNGDTIMAHISPAEANLLHNITDGGSINPKTGLMEFFWGFGGGEKDDGYSDSSFGELNDSGPSYGVDSGEDQNYSGPTREDRSSWSSVGRLTEYKGRDLPWSGSRAKAIAKKRADDKRIADQKLADAKRALDKKIADQKRARDKLKQEQDIQDEERRMRQYAAMPKMDEDPSLDDKSTQARPTRTTSLYGPPEADQRPAYGPLQAPSAQQTALSQATQSATSKPTTTPGVDPSWASSTDPAVQVKNVINTNERLKQEQEDTIAKRAQKTPTTMSEDIAALAKNLSPTQATQPPSNTIMSDKTKKDLTRYITDPKFRKEVDDTYQTIFGPSPTDLPRGGPPTPPSPAPTRYPTTKKPNLLDGKMWTSPARVALDLYVARKKAVQNFKNLLHEPRFNKPSQPQFGPMPGMKGLGMLK